MDYTKKEQKDWFLPTEKTPERIKEYWSPEETAQEVLIQYFRSNRYELCVGWFEKEKWWCNDEEIKHPIVAWKYLSEKYEPEIEWDFVMWNDKSLGDAQLRGVDKYGMVYYGSANWVDGKAIYGVNDIEPTGDIEFICCWCKKILSDFDKKYGKKSNPKLCVTCFTSNA